MATKYMKFSKTEASFLNMAISNLRNIYQISEDNRMSEDCYKEYEAQILRDLQRAGFDVVVPKKPFINTAVQNC